MAIYPLPVPEHYLIHPADLRPSRRVLYAQRLNDSYESEPEPVAGLRSVEDVMNYFKPEVGVMFFGQDGEPLYEVFELRTVDDFSPERLIEQSRFLQLQRIADKETFLTNMRMLIDEARPFETAYRTIALFFANVGESVLDVEFINLDEYQLNVTDKYNYGTFNHIAGLLQSGFNRFIDLTDLYTLVILPGGLPNRASVDWWARLANDHSAVLVTDVSTFSTITDFLTEFEQIHTPTDSPAYSHVLMAVNQVVARLPYANYEETEAVHLPLSAALAGAILRNPLTTPAVSPDNGSVMAVDTLQFATTPVERAKIDALGLITATQEADRLVFQSDRTWYSGTDEWLRKYSTVRGFDWLKQAIGHLLNRRATENWNGRLEKELTIEIMQFLNTVKGPRYFLLSYKPPNFTVDPKDRDLVHLNVTVRLNQSATAYGLSFRSEFHRNPETGLRVAWMQQ